MRLSALVLAPGVLGMILPLLALLVQVAPVLAVASSSLHNNNNENNENQNGHVYRRFLTPTYPGDDGQRRQVEVPVPTDPEDHRVVNLPLHDGSLTTAHYAGLLPASSAGNKYLFYWFFYPDLSNYQGKEEDIPLLLWLNGGPGCSSMDGLFIENGPLQLVLENNNWKITSRQTSWHKSPAYVVYLDQPVGTGISFTTSRDYPNNDEKVNSDFYYWLQQFLNLHSNVLLKSDKKQTKRHFYFSGESHAGHYIPSMMAYIEKQNKKTSPPADLHIKLSGAAIGNGWMDPYHQYSAAGAAYGHGLIGAAQRNALDSSEKECQAQLNNGNYRANVCFGLLDDVVDESFGKSSQYKVSQYDIRFQESKNAPRIFPPGHRILEAYLGGSQSDEGVMTSSYKEVLAAIHATPSRDAGQVYQECTDPPYTALAHQDGLGVMNDVKYLLEAGIRLLFFNGMMDLICNHVGNEILVDKMEWSHQEDYVLAKRSAWMSSLAGNTLAGYMKEYKNLSFLKLRDSGHMAPLDQPEVCLDMMITFMYGHSFQSSVQALKVAMETPDSSCPSCPECDAETTSSYSDAEPTENDTTLMKSIVEHSWLAAVLAVIIVLAFVFCTMRSSASTRNDVTSRPDDSGMEMITAYRDDDGNDFHDDDALGQTERNGGRML